MFPIQFPHYLLKLPELITPGACYNFKDSRVLRTFASQTLGELLCHMEDHRSWETGDILVHT